MIVIHNYHFLLYIYIYLLIIQSKGLKLCYATGDPHYITYDGILLHYHGLCKFDLSSPLSQTQVEALGLIYFRIFSKNELRYGSEAISYPRYVELHIYGSVIRIDKMKYVTVSTCDTIVDYIYVDSSL